ncbi:glycosyltransferase family 32 protein [Clostridium chromiireducens]|nr:glycosyltransferase [Clostridium chromiireducens]
MEKFCKYTKDKELICFGASQMLIDMCCLYDEYNILDLITVIVDNKLDKQNKNMDVCGRSIGVISVDSLKQRITDKSIIVIVAAFFNEIVNQLDNIREFNNIECYIYPIMHYTDRNTEIVVDNQGNDKIPKIIHYCWFGGNEIPEFERKCIESWKKFCPEYEVKLWNEDNYDVHKKPYVREAYDNKQYAFVSDYVRLDVVYKYGGIYFDTDVEVIRPLSSLLKNHAFAGFQHNTRVNTGLGFGAEKGMEIIGEMRDYYDNVSFINEDGTLNRTPCTLYQNEVLKKHGFKENGKNQMIDGMMIYPQDYFQPRCPITGIVNIVEQTYAIHHSRESWVSDINLRKRKTALLSMKEIMKRTTQK